MMKTRTLRNRNTSFVFCSSLVPLHNKNNNRSQKLEHKSLIHTIHFLNSASYEIIQLHFMQFVPDVEFDCGRIDCFRMKDG